MVVRALLISTDSQLCENIRDALKAVPSCQLAVKSRLDRGEEFFRLPGASLIFLHLTAENCETQLTRILEEPTVSGKQVSVVAITDEYDPAQALELLRNGIVEYMPRPLDLRRLAMLADVLTWRARHLGMIRSEQPAEPPSLETEEEGFLVGDSSEMAAIMDQVDAIIPLNTTVLLTGETGSGKSRLSRLIHDRSPRHKEPFIVVSCGALSPSVIESEIFGHVKGAYTGAESDYAGKFAAAAGGTILLDDIDGLSLDMQSKLLRVVDERVFEPVGSNQSVKFRARLIVATNRSLEEEIEAGRFRSDLYFRLNVMAFQIPPLRDRRSCIKALAAHWIAEYAREDAYPTPPLSQDALLAMQMYNWPGNARELRNVIERAVALSRGRVIELYDLPKVVQQSARAEEPTETVPEAISKWFQTKIEAEVNVLVDALTRCGNNRSLAARELGISRPTLYKKMRKHGII